MKPKPLKTPKIYTHYTIAFTGQDNTDWITCRAKFSGVDIVRMGIKQALKQCPKPSKATVEKIKAMVR